MSGPLRDAGGLITGLIWGGDSDARTGPRAWATAAARLVHMVVRELRDGELNLRAASLVYTTLLSMVPALAVSFAVLKAFNVHEELAPTLIGFLSPLGERALVITDQIISFVEHLDLGRLGALGLAFLIATVISLLHKIEQAFNYAWRIERPRPLLERISGYLTVVMIGPMLLFVAMAIVASATRSPIVQELAAYSAIGYLLGLGAKVTPYVLVIAAFTFVYVYMPNTRVQVRSALFGAIVAGVLWASVGWGFASLVATSASYTVIYSSFAIGVLFMMWIYIAWLVLLVGASVAFYHQYPEHLGLLKHEQRMSARMRERLGLGIFALIAASHRNGTPAPNAAELARRLQVPLAPLVDLVSAMNRAKLVVSTSDDPPRYLPRRAVSRLQLDEVVHTIRALHESSHVEPGSVSLPPAVKALVRELDGVAVERIAGRTAECLVDDPESERGPGAAVTRLSPESVRRGPGDPLS